MTDQEMVRLAEREVERDLARADRLLAEVEKDRNDAAVHDHFEEQRDLLIRLLDECE